MTEIGAVLSEPPSVQVLSFTSHAMLRTMPGSQWPFLGTLVLLSSALFLACGSADVEEPIDEGPGPASGSVCPSSSTLTYENFGIPFFTMYCTKCHSENPLDGTRHGAPRGLNWDNLETIRAYREAIDRMAAAGPDAVNSTMPPEIPVPSEDERRNLGEWLVCGAPE
jgi:uncharacterized membrane protein